MNPNAPLTRTSVGQSPPPSAEREPTPPSSRTASLARDMTRAARASRESLAPGHTDAPPPAVQTRTSINIVVSSWEQELRAPPVKPSPTAKWVGDRLDPSATKYVGAYTAGLEKLFLTIPQVARDLRLTAISRIACDTKGNGADVVRRLWPRLSLAVFDEEDHEALCELLSQIGIDVSRPPTDGTPETWPDPSYQLTEQDISAVDDIRDSWEFSLEGGESDLSDLTQYIGNRVTWGEYEAGSREAYRVGLKVLYLSIPTLSIKLRPKALERVIQDHHGDGGAMVKQLWNPEHRGHYAQADWVAVEEMLCQIMVHVGH